MLNKLTLQSKTNKKNPQKNSFTVKIWNTKPLIITRHINFCHMVVLLCIKSSGVWKLAESEDTAHFMEDYGIFRPAMYFKKTISLPKYILTYHCKDIKLINVTPPLYLYLVSPHCVSTVSYPCRVRAPCTPCSHEKQRCVFAICCCTYFDTY